MKGSLQYLNIESLLPFIDNSFTSSIQMFRNLTILTVGDYCRDGFEELQCTFKLNDGNVAELAMALSQLECLYLGRPCFENTCATTAACLLLISVH